MGRTGCLWHAEVSLSLSFLLGFTVCCLLTVAMLTLLLHLPFFFNSEWENMVIKNNMHVLIY